DQAAGAYRVFRSVRRPGAQHRHANGLQARDLDRRAGPGGEFPGRTGIRRAILTRPLHPRAGGVLSAGSVAPGAPARAILVGVDFGGKAFFDASLDELALLAESAGDVAVARVVARRKAPDPAFFVGSGKADELKELVQLHQAEAVVFDQALSPAQQRNLERHLGVAVADRTMLILEIFGERARSHEGKLQVELARLQYLSTRLVRRWSHLERQRGGIGNRGGPGEAQI